MSSHYLRSKFLGSVGVGELRPYMYPCQIQASTKNVNANLIGSLYGAT